MGRLTEEVFNPSCCDGGEGSIAMSAQSCGCDPGASYVAPSCHLHKASKETSTGYVKANILAVYEEFVIGRALMPVDDDGYNAIGLCGEAGEVAEWVKKRVFRGDTRFTEDMLKLELGDVIHYVTRIAIKHGWPLESIMTANMEKLRDRHGLGS